VIGSVLHTIPNPSVVKSGISYVGDQNPTLA
jgi:hypothetical protein